MVLWELALATVLLVVVLVVVLGVLAMPLAL
jgi:hypothetical protein